MSTIKQKTPSHKGKNKGKLSVLVLALSGALAAMTSMAPACAQTTTLTTTQAWTTGNLVINSNTIINTTAGNGINASGTLGTLTNNGSINGLLNGVNNSGAIGALTNNGVINAQGANGINNNGVIAMLVNTGTISGANYGIYNTGTIGTLNNSGLISSGLAAVFLQTSSTLTTLINTGTIAGGIYSNAALNIIGGTGSSFGTLTGGSIESRSGLTLSGNLMLNAGIQAGTNTVTNTGVLQTNNVIIIGGNYVQGAGSTLVLGVTSPVYNFGIFDGGYGRLSVSGNATLDGSSIIVKPAGYALAQGQRYVVVGAFGTLSARGVTYSATGFNVSSSTETQPYMAGSVFTELVLTLGAPIVLTDSTGSTRPVNNATSGNASAALGGLFNYSGTNASLLNVYNPAAALATAASANKAGAQLSPVAVTSAATQAVAGLSESVNNVTASHIDGFRLAQAGNSGVATGEATNSVAVWGQFLDGRATQGVRDSISGYHANYRGLVLGADTQVTDAVRAGGLFSAAKVSVASDGDNTGSSADINNYGLTAYATYSGSPWYVNVQAGVARQQYSTVRAISYTGFSGIANGSFNGQQYSTSVQAGYPLNLDAWLPGATLTPIAGLSYSTLRQNSYTDTGGNGAALTVNSSSTNSLKSELGAKLEKSFDTSYGKMLPSVQLGWRHEYKDGRTQSGASFSADSTGSTAFVTQSATPVSNLAVLNLGVTLAQSANLKLSAGYALESGGDYTAQTGSVQLRWQY